MSEYNKTILTNQGLDLMSRANKGTAKFTITRAATSTEQLAIKSMADLQQLTELPSLMQYGVINDVADSTQDKSIVIGVELVFNNKDLGNGYNINTIGLFAKEDGQDKEILYAITTAVIPESMPDYKNKVLFKFSMTMFVAIAQADNVSINVNDNGVVTKLELSSKLDSLEKKLQAEIDNAGQTKSVNNRKPDSAGNIDLSDFFDQKSDKNSVYTKDQVDTQVAQAAGKLKKISVNGGSPVEPDTAGVANITLPDLNHPDKFINQTSWDLDSLVPNTPMIYQFKGTTLTTSTNASALSAINGDLLTQANGYLVQYDYNSTYAEQLLILYSYSHSDEDVVYAFRCIGYRSDGSVYHDNFKKVTTNNDIKELTNTLNEYKSKIDGIIGSIGSIGSKVKAIKPIPIGGEINSAGKYIAPGTGNGAIPVGSTGIVKTVYGEGLYIVFFDVLANGVWITPNYISFLI